MHLDHAPGVVDAFHGFHIHANNDPANGEGCVGPAFASADGHWLDADEDEKHGHHLGDMPSVYVNSDGSVDARFTLDRVNPRVLPDKVVILHAGRGQLRQRPARDRRSGVLGELAPGDR